MRAIKHLARRIARCLVTRPDLLRSSYQAEVEAGAHPLTGHCYVACEALYHLAAKDAGYRPMVLRVPGGTHWFLENDAGYVLDPTSAQFPAGVDYGQGRGCGFLTKDPSKRCREVMDLMDRFC